MATVTSIATQLFAQSPIARATNAHADQRQSVAGDPATLFASSTLDPGAARLNALADAASNAQKANQAAQIKRLINDARTLADQALYSASTVAKVTGTATNLTPVVDIEMDHGDTITFSDGQTTATYIHAAGYEVQDFIDAVNNTANLNVKASLSDEGRLRLEATGVNGITVGGSADAEELASIGLAAGATVGSVNTGRQELARAFDSIRDQIDAVKLSSRSGAPVTAESLGIRRATGSGNFQSDADITAFLADLEAAGRKLTAEFPDSRSATAETEFTKAAVDLLTGGNDLTIKDQDENGALGLARQVRSQFTATPHSLAGAAAVQVLRLFQ
jgi:hypothetical protein